MQQVDLSQQEEQEVVVETFLEALQLERLQEALKALFQDMVVALQWTIEFAHQLWMLVSDSVRAVLLVVEHLF